MKLLPSLAVLGGLTLSWFNAGLLLEPLQEISVFLENQIQGLVDDVVATVLDEPAILIEHGQTILVKLHCNLLFGSLYAWWNVWRHVNSPLWWKRKSCLCGPSGPEVAPL